MWRACPTGPLLALLPTTLPPPCCPPVHRERLRAALEEVCGKAAADSIHLQLAEDGSVLGAAFLAAAAADWEARGSSGSGGSKVAA